MLNYLWSFMMIFSILIALFNGSLQPVTQGILDSSEAAVMLCIKIVGILAMWMGIMRIAEKAGLIDALAKKMTPLLNFFFPDVPTYHPARKYIATNIIANFLGLGWAATPPGLKAMEELEKLNPHPGVATDAMCTFLIINVSTIQLISINMIAYRASFGSANPTEIVAPSIVATLCSTLAATIYAKMMQKKRGRIR
ncbi:MAG: nucleoside recognition protein [Cellulosilyticaceae bacterium]